MNNQNQSSDNGSLAMVESDPTSDFIREISQGVVNPITVDTPGVPMGMDPAVTWMEEEVMSLNQTPRSHDVRKTSVANNPVAGDQHPDVFDTFIPNPFFDEQQSKGEEDWLMGQSTTTVTTPLEETQQSTKAGINNFFGEASSQPQEQQQQQLLLQHVDASSLVADLNTSLAVENNASSQTSSEKINEKNSAQGAASMDCSDELLKKLSENHPRNSESREEFLPTHCSISQKLPPIVQAWFKADGVSDPLACDGMMIPIAELFGTCSVESKNKSDDGEKAKNVRTMHQKILILKRSGIYNDNLSCLDKDGTICSTHLRLLTEEFPVQSHCQLCKISLQQSSSKTVTAYIQDVLFNYIPGAVVGQLLCDDCTKKMNSIITRYHNRSERAFTLKLKNEGIITEEMFKKRMAEKRFDMTKSRAAKLTWVTIKKVYPLEMSRSPVPSLRYLTRGFESSSLNSRNETAPDLTLKELVELRLSLKTLAMHDLDSRNEICNEWKRLGVTRTFFEFSKIADAVLAQISAVECKCRSEGVTENEVEQYVKKLNRLLDLKKSDVIFLPDGKDLGIVVFDEHGVENTLCFVCSNIGCQGCLKEENQPAEKVNGMVKHLNYLAKVCRICKKSDLNRSHKCSNTTSCENNLCKLYHKDKISSAFQVDVCTEDPDVFPSVICNACKNFLSLPPDLPQTKNLASFLPHSDSCYECKFQYPLYHLSTLTETKYQELVLVTEVSTVPKLSLLAAGVYSTIEPRKDLWKYVTVRNCLDLKRDFKFVPNAMSLSNTSKMLDQSQFWMRLLQRRILPLTTKEAFFYKVSVLNRMIDEMQSENSKLYPKEKKQTMEKYKTILNLPYADCDPWMRNSSKRKGIWGVWVFDTLDGAKFICCRCPDKDCDGSCASPMKPIQKIPFSKESTNKNKKNLELEDDVQIKIEPNLGESSLFSSNENTDYMDMDALLFGTMEIKKENIEHGPEDSVEIIDTPTDEASFYYLTTHTGDITIDFLLSDFNATYNYLVCQSDPSFWTVTEGEHEMVLERGGYTVKIGIIKNEHRGRAVCKIKGSGIEYFKEELLPTLIKLTSCKYLDMNSEPVNGEENHEDEDAYSIDNDNYDFDETYDPQETVFVEEMSNSSTTSSSTNVKSSSKRVNGRKEVGPKQFQCWGCKLKFKYENAYIKHESSCKKAGLPADVRSFPSLKDGRKACPGCSRKFAAPNISYLKHVRTCPKIKRDGFKCPSCPAKFSTSKTMNAHSGMCAKYRKRKGVIVPRLFKRAKMENAAVSIRPVPAPPTQRRGTRKPPTSQNSRSKAKPVYRRKVEYHDPVCQTGSYKCPLCGIRYKLNQAFGKHMKSQECVKKKNKKSEKPSKFTFLYITIHPGIKGDDSVIAYNTVPSLRMLCRGVQKKKSIIKQGKLPALTVKEGLEIYYSLKRSDKSMERDDRWRYLNDRNIFQNYGSAGTFLMAGANLLRTVNYFEEKVKVAKTARNSVLMQKWNDKLNSFLSMPFHDHFNASPIGKFRVFEYPSVDGKSVKVLCLNCCNLSCVGCHVAKVLVKPEQLAAEETDRKAKKAAEAKKVEEEKEKKQTESKNDQDEFEINQTPTFEEVMSQMAEPATSDQLEEAPRPTFDAEVTDETPVANELLFSVVEEAALVHMSASNSSAQVHTTVTTSSSATPWIQETTGTNTGANDECILPD